MGNTVHLQYYGKSAATEAENLKPGSVVRWNCGETSTVAEVLPRGKKQLTVKFDGGFERVFSRTRLVAFVSL